MNLKITKKKVLVTGVAGFIGSHVAESLVKSGKYQVVGLDCFNEYYSSQFKRDNVKWLADQPASDFVLIEEDLLGSQVFKKYRPELVCHLAAAAGVRPSLRDPLHYIRNNIEAFVYLLEECRKLSVERIVYASSSSVYGLNDKVPFSEEDPVERPNSAYACSKRCMEIYANYYQQLYGMPLIGLRFFTVYGPRGRPDMAPYKFLSAIHDGNSITKYGDGSSYRDYTYIDDLVRGFVAALEKNTINTSGKSQLYNLGSQAPVSLNYLIETCQEVVGKPAKIEHLGNQPGDVPATYADLARAKDELSYHPQVSLKEGLDNMYKWMVASGRLH